MQLKKIIFLGLALLLPTCIFVFLKIFGRNEFDVPVLHQHEVLVPPGCTTSYHAPYLLNQELFEKISEGQENPLLLLDFAGVKEVVNRIKTETPEQLNIIEGNLLGLNTDIKKCVLLMPDEADLVLIDHSRQIRGYYQSKKLDEVDRLITEVKIILKQY